MNLTRITLHNFLSYKDETLELPYNDLYLFIGEVSGNKNSNGVGKSGLIKDSVTYALFANARGFSTAGDELIKLGASEMSVTIEFEFGESNYRVIRKRLKGKKTELLLFIDEKNLSKDTIKDTQEYLERQLNLDYDTFTSSVCFEQNEASRFSKMTPKQAKQFIMQLLRLQVYSEYKKKAKIKSSLLEQDINKLEALISLEEIDTSHGPKKIEELKVQKKILEDSIKLREQQQQEIRNKNYQLGTEVSICKANKDSKLSKIKELESKIEKIKKLGNKCPICKSEITAEKLQNLIGEFSKNVELNKLEYKTIEKKQEEISSKIQTFVDENVSKDRAELSKINQEIGHELSFQEQHTKYKSLMEKKKLAEKEMPGKRKQLERLNKLVEAFDENGIPTYIIENSLPEIENIANELISQLSEGRMRIEFQVQKTLKNKDQAETFEILISDECGIRPYYMYSGGEKMIVDFCIRIALSLILARRSGYKVQTLILDEIFGPLDEVNGPKLVELLYYIKKHYEFRKILVITHSEVIKEGFDRVVTLYKDEEGSHIKISS